MNGVQITTDDWIFWQSQAWPVVKVNATIVFSWLVMAILAIGSWLVTRRLTTGTEIPRFQNVLEVLVTGIRDQIRDVSRQDPGQYLPFVGTLFLFIAMATLLSVVPGYRPPTGSLSTTAALATCVFVAVPLYGIASQGFGGYSRHYIQPTPLMLPFNIVGELSRTLALAVRLYGNMMSGTVIAAILVGFVPLFVPVLMQLLGLLTGMIQAYIFAVLAMVYIASATKVLRVEQQSRQPEENDGDENRHQSLETPEGGEHG
jgi:F-type H+-transporting ATPase subunit a